MALTSEGALLNHIAQLLVRIDALQEELAMAHALAEQTAQMQVPPKAPDADD
jgi:hypothetical protein